MMHRSIYMNIILSMCIDVGFIFHKMLGFFYIFPSKLNLKSSECKMVNFKCRLKIIYRYISFLLKILVPSSENGVKIVVSRLVRGNYFGEISLLKLDDGHNRLAILFAQFFFNKHIFAQINHCIYLQKC